MCLGPDYMSRAGPVSRAGVSSPGSQHACKTQQKSTSQLHDNRASPVNQDPGIAVPGSGLTELRFCHVIAFAGPARLIKPMRVQNQARSCLPSWLASCDTRLKVISAHRSSPAHVIRPLVRYTGSSFLSSFPSSIMSFCRL